MAWHPMEEAPKDRPILIKLTDGSMRVGRWRSDVSYGSHEWADGTVETYPLTDWGGWQTEDGVDLIERAAKWRELPD